MNYTREQWENLSEFKRALNNVNREISKLEKNKQFLSKTIYDLGRITEFYNDIPLDVTGDRGGSLTTIHTVPTNNRGSKIFGSESHPHEKAYIVI